MKEWSKHLMMTLLLLCLYLTKQSQGQIFAKYDGPGFSNQVIRVVTAPYPPFYMETHEGEWSGLMVDLMDTMIKIAGDNNSLVWALSSDGYFGNYDPATGTSTGLVKDILDGTADLIAAPITVTPSRSQAIHFFAPFWADSISTLISSEPSYQYSPIAFMYPFTPRLWVLIFCSTFLFGIVIWKLDHLSPFGYHHQFLDREERKKHSLTMRNSTENAIMSLFGAGGLPLRHWSGRIFLIAFYFYAYIITASYYANLTANLYNRGIQYEISSLEQAIEQGAPIYVINQTATQESLTQTFPASVPLQVTCEEYTECLDQLVNSQMGTFVGDTSTHIYSENTPPCDTLIIGSSFNSQFYSLAAAYNWSLTEAMASVMSYVMRGTQVMSDLRVKWFLPGACKAAYTPQQIDIPQLAGIWYMMLIFIAAGVVCLGIEKLVSKREDLVEVHAYLGGRERLISRMRATERKAATSTHQSS